MAQVLAQWWHSVASSETLNVLHRAMCPASHRRIRMVIENAIDSPVIFVIVNSVVTHYHSKIR